MTMTMSENEHYNITEPEFDFVTVEIRRVKIDEAGNKIEVVEEKQIPTFLYEILSAEES